MREIKFRVWCKYKHSFLDDGDTVIDTCYQSAILLHFNDAFKDVQCFDHVFMQYTGLKDKNGKEIYEGDIVQHETKSPYIEGQETLKGTGQIEWCNECCGFHIYGIYHNSLRKFINIEVIGNIYENPELNILKLTKK